MILFPSLYIKQTLNGITAWALHVLPSVLPFMFFTKILTSLGTIEKFSTRFNKITYKLFKTPAISSFVFLTGVVSGYPIGAKMTADLYLSGKITKQEACKMCSFCSTSGPMFILGAVGVGMLGNSTYGYIILISHILGALINGILYRNLKIKNEESIEHETNRNQPKDLSSIILDSTLSILSIGSIIAIFFVIITAFSPIFSFLPSKISAILEGIIEITKGCSVIATSFHGALRIIPCTFIISFGGLSTILQSLTMLNKLKMPVALFILQKTTHAIISTFISIILTMFCF